MPPEVNPKTVFERLFGSAKTTSGRSLEPSATSIAGRFSTLSMRILSALQKSLGPTDRRKLTNIWTGIREIEKRIESAAKSVTPAMDVPEGVPSTFAEHVKLMFDLMAVAFQTDSTRIATFMIGREGSNRRTARSVCLILITGFRTIAEMKR